MIIGGKQNFGITSYSGKQGFDAVLYNTDSSNHFSLDRTYETTDLVSNRYVFDCYASMFCDNQPNNNVTVSYGGYTIAVSNYKALNYYCQMYVIRNKSYHFRGKIDDNLAVKIDDTLICTGGSTFADGTFIPSKSGLVELKIYTSNNAGGYGNWGSGDVYYKDDNTLKNSNCLKLSINDGDFKTLTVDNFPRTFFLHK